MILLESSFLREIRTIVVSKCIHTHTECEENKLQLQMESIGKQAEAGLDIIKECMYVAKKQVLLLLKCSMASLPTCLARVTFTYTLIQNKR